MTTTTAKEKLVGFSQCERAQIKALATQLVVGMIERNEIELTDAAIKAAMPGAVDDAKKAVAAVSEYLCG